MHFTKVSWLLLAKSWMVWFGVDVAIAWLVLRLSHGGSDFELWQVLVVLVVIWALQFVVWLRAILASAIVFHWFGRKSLATAYAAGMEKFGIPAGDGHYYNASQYLDEVVADEQLTPTARQAAALFAGFLSYPGAVGRPIEGARMEAVFRDALAQLRR